MSTSTSVHGRHPATEENIGECTAQLYSAADPSQSFEKQPEATTFTSKMQACVVEVQDGDTSAARHSTQSQYCSLSGRTESTSVSGIREPHQQQQEVPLEQLLHAVAKQGRKIPTGLLQQQKLLTNVSHLHLNGLQLTQLDSLRLCPQLQVLYIYDNLLSSISNIAGSRLLTHLYCQNNQLTSLQGLQHLPLLQKLYVQGNCLAVIDCLNKAQHLEELHVSDQRIGAGSAQSPAGRQFEPGSLQQDHSQVLLLQQRQHMHHAHKQQLATAAQGFGMAAVSDEQCGCQQQQQQQQHDQLMLFNDGCVMQHRFTSTPTTPQQDTSAPEAAPTGSICISSSGIDDSPAGSQSQSSTGRTAGALWFDPASLSAISCSLRVLAAANCGITDPSPLAVLTQLQALDLAGNAIVSMAAMQPVLGALGQLRELDLRGNPCCHAVPKYRDSVVLAAAHSLEQLDGEDVTPAHRVFLQALHSRKSRAARLRQQEQQQQQQEHGALGQQQLQQQASGTGSGPGEFGAAAGADSGDYAHQQQQPGEHQQHEDDFPIAAGHHAALTSRCHQALDSAAPGHGATAQQGAPEPLSIMASGLQLAVSLQPCRAVDTRPTQAGGFKVVPTVKPGQGRLGAAAAAGGAQLGRHVQK